MASLPPIGVCPDCDTKFSHAALAAELARLIALQNAVRLAERDID